MKKIIGLLLCATIHTSIMASQPDEKKIKKIALPAALETIPNLGPTDKNLKVAYLLARTITQPPINQALLGRLVLERYTRTSISNIPHLQPHQDDQILPPLSSLGPVRVRRTLAQRPQASELCSLYNGKHMPVEEKNSVFALLNNVNLQGNLFDYKGQTKHLSRADRKELTGKIIPAILEKLCSFRRQLDEPIKSVLCSERKDYLTIARRSYFHHPPGMTGEEEFVEHKIKALDSLIIFFRCLLSLPLPHMAMPYLPYGRPLGTKPSPYCGTEHEDNRAMRFADINVVCTENHPAPQEHMIEGSPIIHEPPSLKKERCCLPCTIL